MASQKINSPEMIYDLVKSSWNALCASMNDNHIDGIVKSVFLRFVVILKNFLRFYHPLVICKSFFLAVSLNVRDTACESRGIRRTDRIPH